MWFDPRKLLSLANMVDDPPADPGDDGTPPAGGGAGGGDPPPSQDWKDREIAAKHRQIKDRDARLSALEQELATLRASQQTPPVAQTPPAATPPAGIQKTEAELQREISEAATAEAQRIVAQREFTGNIQKTNRSGVEAYGDKWQGAINMIDNLGGLSPEDSGMIMGTDNPHQVIFMLGTNPGLFQELRDMPIARRFTEYAKLGMPKPKDDTKPPPKPSDTPPPVHSLGSRPSSQAAEVLKDDLPDEEWYAIRQKQKAESRGRPWSPSHK